MSKYKRFFDENILLYEAMVKEAVINPIEYLKNIENKIYDLQLFNYNNITSKKICDLLNLKFYFNNIKFFVDKHIVNGVETSIDYGINRGATIPDKKATIGIFLNSNINYIKDKQFHDNFIQWLLVILKHELIHRGQNLRIRDAKLRSKVMKKDYKSKIEYLSDPQEIMARAWEIVELFKLKNYINSEILNLLKNDTKEKYQIDTLAVYHQTFNNDKVLKRLYKYMYEYIQKGI